MNEHPKNEAEDSERHSATWADANRTLKHAITELMADTGLLIGRPDNKLP